MKLEDPKARTETGIAQQTALWSAPAPEPGTVYEAAWRDFVFAEVWSRPGLDRRSRFLISLASMACTDMPGDILDAHVRGALTLKELTLSELREAALHLAVYAGWSRGAILDQAITRVADAMGLKPASFPPIRAEPWDPAARKTEGAANFTEVMTFGPSQAPSPYIQNGILNFVFGEMWMRPGLDQRARRWVTLVGVAESAADTPIRTHVFAAMASGNATPEEMQEFVLQYAVHCGWPRASTIQGAVFEMADKYKQGLGFDGRKREQ